MSKKINKLLFGAALVGAAVGGGIAYLNKCKKDKDTLDEDFDEFQDDFEEEDLDDEETPISPSREYVTIPKEEKEAEAVSETEEDAAAQDTADTEETVKNEDAAPKQD